MKPAAFRQSLDPLGATGGFGAIVAGVDSMCASGSETAIVAEELFLARPVGGVLARDGALLGGFTDESAEDDLVRAGDFDGRGFGEVDLRGGIGCKSSAEKPVDLEAQAAALHSMGRRKEILVQWQEETPCGRSERKDGG
jgi:hypothetical protein